MEKKIRRVKMKRLAVKMGLAVCAAGLVLLLTGSGESLPSFCPCQCAGCSCQPSNGPLLALPKEHLITVRILNWAELTGEDAEKALDILNSFVPVSVEECGGPPIGGGGVYVDYYDSRRFLCPIQDSIYMGEMKYTGEPGCLDELYRLRDEVSEREHQELVEKYLREIRGE